MLTMDDTDMSH